MMIADTQMISVGDKVCRRTGPFFDEGTVKRLSSTHAWVHWRFGGQTHRISLGAIEPLTPNARERARKRNCRYLRRDYAEHPEPYRLYRIIKYEKPEWKPTHPGPLRDQPIMVTLPTALVRIRDLYDFDDLVLKRGEQDGQ